MTIRVVAEIGCRMGSLGRPTFAVFSLALLLAGPGLGCSSATQGKDPRDLMIIPGTGGQATGGVAGSGGQSTGGQPDSGGNFLGGTGGVATTGGSATGGGQDTGGKDCTMERCSRETLDVDNCGFQTVEGEVETIEFPGTVLVIYDRSGSMDQDWGAVPRYEAAGNALISAMQPLQDVLTVGAVFFPSLDANAMSCACNPADFTHWFPGGCCLSGTAGSCVVNDITQPDQINFRPGPEFIAELPNQWRLQGAGGTPLEAGLVQANAAIQSTTFENSLSIIIVTDGQPTCGSDDAASVQQVAEWAAAGYSTYVVGLPGAQGAADLLNQLAATGGTGQYIDPGDPANLETQLRGILLETVRTGIESCSINLTPPAEAPDKLRMVVTVNGVDQAVGRMLSDDASWDLSADGAVVTLEGRLCEEAKSGAYDGLRFDFGCKDLPPLDPPGPDLQ